MVLRCIREFGDFGSWCLFKKVGQPSDSTCVFGALSWCVSFSLRLNHNNKHTSEKHYHRIAPFRKQSLRKTSYDVVHNDHVPRFSSQCDASNSALTSCAGVVVINAPLAKRPSKLGLDNSKNKSQTVTFPHKKKMPSEFKSQPK